MSSKNIFLKFFQGNQPKDVYKRQVEDLEPPLAHMIPELTSNLLLPVAIFTWMMVIDWRMGRCV